MSDCNCSPSPLPSCEPVSNPSGSCDSIRMFFGYKPKTGTAVPGSLSDLYYTGPMDTNTIHKGFEIPNFSAKSLFDAKILKSDITFTLTEAELLSTGSFEGWCVYAADNNVFNSGNPCFGLKCMEDLNVDMDRFLTESTKMFVALHNGDAGAFLSVLYGAILGPPKDKDIIFDDLENNECDHIIEAINVEKLRVCYNWIKNIADTYYGKSFLVKVADAAGEGQVLPGVCIKDEDGNDPNFDKPFYIEGDGSSQGYYSSDEIAEGGFPKQCSKNILGLTKIDWVQNSDGKIASFVKIGQISEQNPACDAVLQDRKIYKKFTNQGNKCVDWTIDLSKLDPNNYHIETKDNNDYLYLKCDVENRFYIDDNGTWVNIILTEKVPLTNSDINPILAIHDFFYLLTDQAKEIFDRFLDKFKKDDKPMAGTRSSMTQLNLATALPPCLIPEGAVIPFKSNVYRYGPYYHVSNPDDGGGVDVVIEENIAPWNFIKPGDTSFPDDYPYCAMDKFGKELAKFTTKGLQKIEKGRATVVGLPCDDNNLGKSVDNGYDEDKEVGPTLLTDISVEYGSGGFNTTYNFSTYSPRLGKSEKYLRDAWTQNLERTKYIDSYLRAEREKSNSLRKEFRKNLLDKNYYFTPLPKHKDSTPHRIMFSGYYLSTKQQDLDTPDPVDYEDFDPSMPDDVVDCSASPSSSIESSSDPEVSGIRRYIFSESDKGYTVEHFQKSYFQLAGMSFDGFYLPVSIRGVNSDPTIKELDNGWTNQARLPRFAMRCKDSGGEIIFVEWDSDNNLDIKNDPGYPISTKTRDEIPPFKFILDDENVDCYSLPIHQKYLNPYTSKQILSNQWEDIRKNSTQDGFVISSIVFGQEYLDYQISHTHKDSELPNGIGVNFPENERDEYIRQQYENFRIPALRGPLVLQGWGYDTTGKPIPNSADNYINTEYGQFKKNGLTNKFMKDWLQNPKTWPVGPIDLRFDRERGVWTCASPNKIVVARLKEDLCKNGCAKAQLLNPEAAGIRFYEKYHISGPQGENIKLSMDRTEITVYDFLGETIKKCSKVYVYYDDNRYIVLKSEAPETIVRFRHIKLCANSGLENPSDYYGDDTWGAYAGYGDKYYNYHTYGIRIDCDGNPVDINGKKPELEDIENEFTLDFIKENATDWLIKLNDNAGKFGPSFGKFNNYNDWINKASTGYATLISNDISCVDPSASPSPSPSPETCELGSDTECPLDEETNEKLSSYDILFIESYARFLHGCLTQDLYLSSQEAESAYPDDDYKINNPSGNASIGSGIIYYGDSPNGQEPLFIDNENNTLPIRVFDPWLDKNNDPLECYNPEKSIFYNATSGTAFTAVFNEKEKKYYIWQINKKSSPIIRFKAIKLCTSSEQPDDAYDDDWGLSAGYGDKYHNFHTYGVRIDCDGNIINRRGKTINEAIPEDEIPDTDQEWKDFFTNKAKDWLVRLNDNAGKFGPSYSIFTNFEDWNNKAATGYASIIDNSEHDPSSCALGTETDCATINEPLDSYDILFIESYARFLHGCLTQDLYISSDKASELYNDDNYKISHPSGNASIEITHFYGDAPNGKEPIYLDENYEELPIRVFDPWLDKDLNPISCYDPKDSIFYNATSGTAFTAVFNEKEKKYYLWQLNKKPKPSIVRFKLIEFCDYNSLPPPGKPDYGDDWTEYAGYRDKFPDRHILGIRINCDGDIVDKNGNILAQADLFDETGMNLVLDTNLDKAKDIFINILDTVGTHGPARATYIYSSNNNNLISPTQFNNWFNNTATGFGAICEIPPSGICTLGIHNDRYEGDTDQCVTTNSEFDTYEILFLDTYARFVECTLKQDLYVTQEEVEEKYGDDEYKIENPSGNASAEILEYYGDSPNGRIPQFFKEGGEQIEFRVFDPFKDVPKDENPFRHLKEDDKVLTIFDENLKKYIIWQSIKRDDKVIKFALINDKNVNDITAQGVVVDQYGRPINADNGELLNENNFAENFITIRDPFVSRTSFAPAPDNGNLGPNLTAFGPALGSNILDEHYNGIPLANLGGGYGSEENMPPFLGFALKRFLENTDPENDEKSVVVYEMFHLEHYARYIKGKICTKTANFMFGGLNRYLATLGSHKEGIKPIGRSTGELPRGNLIINHPLDQFTGTHSAIGGDLIAGAADSSYANVDGCEFIALLDSETSTADNLVYNIIESERFALAGKITIKYQDIADTLNANTFDLVANGAQMESEWYQGFVWDQVNSQVNFELMTVSNREEWINKALFIKDSVITVYLDGIDGNGNPQYSVDNGGTIARAVQRYISNDLPGLYGLPNGIPANERKIAASDDFFDGLDPSNIDDANKPKIDMSDDQQWMTYDQGIITGLWDETLDNNGEVKNCKYKIIYAQEAPVIITGTAIGDISPEDPEATIAIEGLYPSCQGLDRDPVGDLLAQVENPMGHGAKDGDHVTVQRVYHGAVKFGIANYYYIIIGTGDPPGPLKD